MGARGRLLAAAVAASALAAAAAAQGSVAGPPRCGTPGLVVWLETDGNGAAGSVYYLLELTNLSGHTCKVYGYPGVSAVDLAGGSSAVRRLATAPSGRVGSCSPLGRR